MDKQPNYLYMKTAGMHNKKTKRMQATHNQYPLMPLNSMTQPVRNDNQGTWTTWDWEELYQSIWERNALRKLFNWSSKQLNNEVVKPSSVQQNQFKPPNLSFGNQIWCSQFTTSYSDYISLPLTFCLKWNTNNCQHPDLSMLYKNYLK